MATIPDYQDFDGQWADYRMYQADDVPKGILRVTAINRHPSDGVVFEQWRSSAGATFAQNVSGGGKVITDEALDHVERIVWVGHHEVPINKDLDGRSGWRLDFRRKG